MEETKNTIDTLETIDEKDDNNNDNNSEPFYYITISGLVCRLDKRPTGDAMRELINENSSVEGLEGYDDPNY